MKWKQQLEHFGYDTENPRIKKRMEEEARTILEPYLENKSKKEASTTHIVKIASLDAKE